MSEDQRPEGQCWTSSSGIGKSATFAVANTAPAPTADAAIRQSAWCRVTPIAACSLRQRPARRPSATPKGAVLSACTRRRAAGSSSDRRPRQISSTDIADTQGATPWRLNIRRRSAAGFPLSASINTVESSRSRDMAQAGHPRQPERIESLRRCARTHPAGSSSQSCPVSVIVPRDSSISSQRRSFSRLCRMRAAMNALRRRGPARRSRSSTRSSSS